MNVPNFLLLFSYGTTRYFYRNDLETIKSQNFTTSLISTFRKGWLINRGNQPLLASPFQGAGLVTLNNCPAGAGAGNDAVERKN